MADYRDKLDEWREAARRKARDLDEKYNIRERVEDGARVAGEAAKRGAEAVKTGAERARTEAERLGEEFDLGAAGRVTVSLGVAELPACAHTNEELRTAADAALYEAKLGGRDRAARAPARENPAPALNVT